MINTQITDTSTLIEELKLVANDTQSYSNFGISVSITSDGDRVAVGAILKNEKGFNSAGAVYIFSRSGTTWVEETKLVTSDPEASALFGTSVSMSANGDRIAIGAENKNENGLTNVGAAYIFSRSDTTWTQETKLVMNNLQAYAGFGSSVSMSANGDRVAIGAYRKNEESIYYTGATYIFSRSDTTWTQEAELVAGDPEAGSRFGFSVSITDDGSRVAIGAYFKNGDDLTNAGAVYIFSRSEKTWTQEAKLVASDPEDSSNFGTSVSITDDGSRVAIGTCGKNEAGFTYVGVTYIFSRSGTAWTQEAKLVASDLQANARFGRSVYITANGDRVAIGAPYKTENGKVNAGSIYIFNRSGTTWTQEAKLAASDYETNSLFGESVSMSTNGNRVVIGAYNKNEGNFNSSGAVYIFN